MALFRTVQLLVDRGAGVIVPTTVFEFEVPILLAMHGSMGSGLVRETGEGTLDIPDDDAEAVYATMQAKYGGKVGEAAMTEAYQNAKVFAKAFEESRVRPAKAAKEKAAKDADTDSKD